MIPPLASSVAYGKKETRPPRKLAPKEFAGSTSIEKEQSMPFSVNYAA